MAIKKGRAAQVELRDRKIEEMTLDEVRQMLCFKHGQDPEKCEGCPGLATCKAGQRVQVLKDEVARAAAKQRFASQAKQRKDAEAYIREVLAAEDPREYLMEHEGLDSRKAGKKLQNWRMRHPELFEGVTWKKLPSGRAAGSARAVNTRDVYEECMASGNPVKHYMELRGCTYNSAYHTVQRMKEKFGEIPEKKEDSTPTAEPQTILVSAEPQGDEVSVEDFLNEFTEKPAQCTARAAEPEVKEIRKVHAGDGLVEALKDKYFEMTVRMEQALREMDKLNAEIATVRQEMDALEITARVFGVALDGREARK